MDWLKIGTAIFVGAMIIIIWPTAMHWFKHGPRGTKKDWMGLLLPLAGLVILVLLLVALVR